MKNPEDFKIIALLLILVILLVHFYPRYKSTHLSKFPKKYAVTDTWTGDVTIKTVRFAD